MMFLVASRSWGARNGKGDILNSVEIIQDHFAIRDVIQRYCRGVDRLDIELIDSVYWDDSYDDHGLYKGPGKGFGAWVIPILRQFCQVQMHVLGQSNIELDADQAAVETYYVAYHGGENGAGKFIESSGGRYVDTFSRRHGEWRIARRVVVLEWSHVQQGIEEAAFGLDRFTYGKRDRSDLSYASRRFPCVTPI